MKFKWSISLVLSLLASASSWADSPQVPPIIDATAMKDGRDGRASVDPCVDFYQFSCGNWIDTTTLPPEKNRMYRNGAALGDQIDLYLNRLLETYAGSAPQSPAAAKQLGDFYASCMNKEATV